MVSIYQKCYKRLKRQFQRRFPKYTEIDMYLKLLAILHPRHVRLEVLGYSIQGRPIKMIILQHNQMCPKMAVMIEGGIHAREWLSHSTVLYVIDSVLNSKSMLKYMDFYIIPCLNPDGYVFSHNSCRLWRKNMNKNSSVRMCDWGVDLNRNFSVAFGSNATEEGSSNRRESSEYHGKKALSEPESRCLAKAVRRYACHIKLYIAVHCFGHLIMYPWGYTTAPCNDNDVLHECATQAQVAMKRMFSKSKFRVGQLSKTMYVSSGNTADFVRQLYDIKFAFTMELHRAGNSGFDAKPQKILPVAKETLVGIESMIKYVYEYYRSRKKM